MAPELQNWSTVVAVEAVPEMAVPCLSSELQTWSTAEGCSSVLLGPSSLREELQTWSTAAAVEAVPEMAVPCVSELQSAELAVLLIPSIQRLMGAETAYD